MQMSTFLSGYAMTKRKGNHRRVSQIDESVSWGYGEYL